jgi:aspartyl protease family protein
MIDRTILFIGAGTFVVALGGMQLGSGMSEPTDGRAPVARAAAEGAAAASPAPAPAPAPARAAPMPAYMGTIGADGALTLNRQGDGHFHTQLDIGGTAIPMVVDTGASQVVLTEADAARIGIRPAHNAFNQRAQTAGGLVVVAPVTLERVRLGRIDLDGVSAIVVRGQAMQQSLLGQSVLNRLDSITIEGGQMRLR